MFDDEPLLNLRRPLDKGVRVPPTHIVRATKARGTRRGEQTSVCVIMWKEPCVTLSSLTPHPHPSIRRPQSEELQPLLE